LAGSVIVFARAVEGQAPEDKVSSDQTLQNRNEIRLLERLSQRWPGGADIDYDALLVEALDITTAELQEAREEAFTTAVELAADEEYITQRQADMILAVRAMKGTINQGELIADALGISLEELQEARQNRALQQLIKDLDMTQADVREAVLEQYEEVVDQAVEEGLLTEEQAETLRDRPGLLLRDPRNVQRQNNNQGRDAGRDVQGQRGRGTGGIGPFQGGNRPPAPT